MAKIVYKIYAPINISSILEVQYTLANPNRGVSIKKKSVPISEFVRISEVIYMGNFAANHSKIYSKLDIQILINPSEILLLYYYNHYNI